MASSSLQSQRDTEGAGRLDTALFRQFADIAYRRAGIRLGPGKEALVGARISKRIRALVLQGPAEYLEHLLGDDNGDELVQFLDVISTNFTSFYREAEHFELLGTFVRNRLAENRSRLRFWSAACSSGEEPYTMALTIADALGDASVDWRILATDISTRILQTAETAVYSEAVLSTVPRHLRDRFFVADESAATAAPPYRVKDQIRQHVAFQRLNLSTPPFPMRGPLDFVMCRNVMIYFDKRVRQGLVSAIEELLAPDGILCIGHTETLTGIDTELRAVRPSIYAHRSSLRLDRTRDSLTAKGLGR